MVVKIITCVVRKPGMTHDEFDLYWRSQHGAVIQSVPEFTRHVRRYGQRHRAARDTPFPAISGDDGVAEPWYDNMTALNAAFTEPRYLEVIRPDELKFVDIARTFTLVTEELEIF